VAWFLLMIGSTTQEICFFSNRNNILLSSSFSYIIS
jgi:hypothetical protein